MKKLLLLAMVVVLAASCTETLPSRFTRLADNVESQWKDFSQDQWEKANAQFEKLFKEYTDNYSTFKPSEKREINAAIAKYSAAALKSGLSDISSEINGIIGNLPDSIDNLIDEAKGFLHNLGLE